MGLTAPCPPPAATPARVGHPRCPPRGWDPHPCPRAGFSPRSRTGSAPCSRLRSLCPPPSPPSPPRPRTRPPPRRCRAARTGSSSRRTPRCPLPSPRHPPSPSSPQPPPAPSSPLQTRQHPALPARSPRPNLAANLHHHHRRLPTTRLHRRQRRWRGVPRLPGRPPLMPHGPHHLHRLLRSTTCPWRTSPLQMKPVSPACPMPHWLR